MSMSYKDFVALAEAIREHNKYAFAVFDDEHLNTLAKFCSQQNPKFNRERWLQLIK